MAGAAAGELNLLPEGCIANIISFTSPADACRLSSVSKLYKSAAEYDDVWERFLPPEYPTLISNSTSSSSSSSLVGLSSTKELFFSLCDNPILIDEGKKSFSLEKHSGKKCYMISARALSIVWGDTPEYWTWISVPEARFPEVVELIDVCWLEIHGRISTHSLSPRTLYSTYFVYKKTEDYDGFAVEPVKVSVALVGSTSESHNRTYYFDQQSRQRHDGWLEIELGDFFNEGDEAGELEMSVLEVESADWKSGIIVQGMEIRPKQGR